MSMKKKLLSALLSGIMLVSACAQPEPPQEIAVDPRGSAKVLDGKTVVVSIFANDYVCEWDFTKEADVEMRNKAKADLGVALDYISSESKKWGKNAEFVYDWEADPDLYAERNIPYEACNDEFWTSRSTKRILEHTFDSDALLERYAADNIFFIFHFNTPLEHQCSSYAVNSLIYSNHYYEYCVINMTFMGGFTSPTEYAHEILHLFGVLDFYMADDSFGISQEFVDYCAENYPDELMYITYENVGKLPPDRITATINEFTAYYIGWTDHSDEQERFGMHISEHVPKIDEE